MLNRRPKRENDSIADLGLPGVLGLKRQKCQATLKFPSTGSPLMPAARTNRCVSTRVLEPQADLQLCVETKIHGFSERIIDYNDIANGSGCVIGGMLQYKLQ
jgi:hypothetical protein